MDEQKKQKVLLAVLGVAVLGAGTYFVAFRDSSDAASRAASNAPAVRQARDTPAETSKVTTRTRPTAERSTAAPQAAQRRERTELDRDQPSERRTRGRTEDRTKKKTITPAA